MIYELKFTQDQLNLIGQLLHQAPYGVAAPLINAINHQIAEAQKPQEKDDE